VCQPPQEDFNTGPRPAPRPTSLPELQTARPKAVPGTEHGHDSHDRVRTDRISNGGNVTLRITGRLHHIGIGKTYAGTYVLLLVHDVDRVGNRPQLGQVRWTA
jgi:hypothetical protein